MFVNFFSFISVGTLDIRTDDFSPIFTSLESMFSICDELSIMSRFFLGGAFESSSSSLGAALGGSNPSYFMSVSSTVSRCFTL